MTVGQRIRQLRIERGLSQNELAEKMGYSGKSAVSMAENCGDNITTTKVEKFAKALGCSVKYLMFGEEDEISIEKGRKISFDKYDPRTVERAIAFIKAFEGANPEVQMAIQSLLKLNQSDP